MINVCTYLKTTVTLRLVTLDEPTEVGAIPGQMQRSCDTILRDVIRREGAAELEEPGSCVSRLLLPHSQFAFSAAHPHHV